MGREWAVSWPSVDIIPTSHGPLTLLIGHEGLDFINIIELTVSESQMISLIKTAPDWGEHVGCCQEHELREVEDVEELGAIADAKPHPISV